MAMAMAMGLAPARSLLPVLVVEPSSIPVASPFVSSHPSLHSFPRNSRSFLARIVQVEEQQHFHPQPREPEPESTSDVHDSGNRWSRAGGRYLERGFKDARNIPPWKLPTNYGQAQTGMGKLVNQSAAKERFHSQAQSAVENAAPETRVNPQAQNADDIYHKYVARRQQRGSSQQVVGKPTTGDNAVPPYKRNHRPLPRQQAWREGRRGFHANGDVAGATQDGNVEAEKSAMARIVEKLRRMQEEGQASGHIRHEPRPNGRTAGALILPKPNQDLFNMSKNWSVSEHSITEDGKGVMDAKFPWERDEYFKEGEDGNKEIRVKPPSIAELTIPGAELRRLQTLAIQLQERLRIGRLGVTDNIARAIKDRWRSCEVAKVKCEGPPAYNMKKTVQELEQKTGGLVIWKAGGVAVVYRGKDYCQPRANEEVVGSLERKLEGLISPDYQEKIRAKGMLGKSDEAPIDRKEEDATALNADIQTPQGTTGSELESNPQIQTDYEREVENILKDLGPRFEEWSGSGPCPVDADLLPAITSNYRPPYRLLPYGVKPKLSNAEQTNLRRLSRHLAPHFVLGRVKGLEGLVAAIVKLWEKSEIVKIAVKRGVQNTNNERMAEEIKRLSGGVLLARDKQFITLYRGKDFLPQQVAIALTEREAMVRALQEEEESGRADRSIAIEPIVYGTPMNEASAVEPSWVQLMDSNEQMRLKREAVKARQLEIVRRIETKLAMALKKKEKAMKELEKVEVFLKPIDRPADLETITEEERFMFRKVGLSMKAFLLMGRRGIFDGVVENMHLHWKHRELVKVIVKEKDQVRLQETARMLESESGGILVAVESISKGQAIIVYRGKNYRRPSKLRPSNLLTKRKALKRSIEIQRREALSKHIQALEEQIVKMRAGLSKFERSDPDEFERSEPDEFQSSESDESEEDSNDDYGDLPSKDQEVGGQLQNKQGEKPSMVGHSGIISLSGCTATLTRPPLDKEKLKRLSRLGPIFTAEPLTERQVLKLQKEARSLSKASHFLVGRSDVLTGLSKAIRLYFLDHALVKIGVKGRGPGTFIQDLVHELEDLTGGVLVSQQPGKLLMYRGWPNDEELPITEIYDSLSPEMLDALEAEGDDWQDDVVDDDYSVRNESNASDIENDEDNVEGMYSDEGNLSNDDAEADHEDENCATRAHSDLNNVAEDEAGEVDEYTGLHQMT